MTPQTGLGAQRWKAIDLFSGLGGFTTGAEAAGVEVVWAGNHWQTAVDWHSANHPRTVHACQDLQQADWAEVPPHDIGLGSPSCIPFDQDIVMGDRSYKLAGDIQLGDMVLTHQGRARPVVNIWKKNFSGALVTLEMWGNNKEPVSMTGDHLVWIRRKQGKRSKLGAPRFVRADEVRPKDVVAFPQTPVRDSAAREYVDRLFPQPIRYTMPASTVTGYTTERYEVPSFSRCEYENSTIGAKVALDGDSAYLWWLVGHYLGDGQCRGDRPQVGWSIGCTMENKVRVKAIVASLGLRTWDAGVPGNETVFTSSTHLHALVKSFGTLCWNKHIPPEILSFPKHLLEALVDGYLATDGNYRADLSNPEWRVASVSIPLLQGIQRICWQLGWTASIARQDYARTTTIQGRQVECRDAWQLSIKKEPSKFSRTKFADGLLWRCVRSASSCQVTDIPVVDFEVEQDHTFCLPGLVVHNCQGFSKARGKHQKRHDVMRATMWAVVSCAEFWREQVWVVENVPEAMTDWVLWPSWKDAMQRLGYAVSPHVIDAADHGVPQHRERLFVVCTRSRAPLELKLPQRPHVPIDSVIDWSAPKWSPVEKRGRSINTLARIASGRARFGDRFVAPFYGSGSGLTGRSVNRPVGTITTRDRWAVVDGERMRMMSKHEVRAAMGFPTNYRLPPTHKESIHLLGNAVCPPVPTDILRAIHAQV